LNPGHSFNAAAAAAAAAADAVDYLGGQDSSEEGFFVFVMTSSPFVSSSRPECGPNTLV